MNVVIDSKSLMIWIMIVSKKIFINQAGKFIDQKVFKGQDCVMNLDHFSFHQEHYVI